MEIRFIIEDAIANPLKFTRDDLPTNERATFDQRRYAQTKNATVDPDKFYNQKFESADPIRIQFYSNFPLNQVTVIDCEENVIGAPLIPAIAVNYRNKKFRASCRFASISDKLFIYFNDSRLYLDEDFTEEGDLVAYGGRLPNINAVPGDLVRYSFNGVDFFNATITAIVWNPTLQAEGYLTDETITLVNPIDGYVEITYDEKPANLYAQQIPLDALAPGKYFIRRQHGVNALNVSFTSEPIEVAASHPETLALEYRHEGTYNRDDLWNYVYLSDWFNLIRIPADFYKFTPAGEVDIDVNDNGVPRILRAVPYRQIEISFLNMPSWLADKLQIALSHDEKIVNGYEYEIENFGQFELIDRLDLGTYTVNLRQVNDRAKKTDEFIIDVTAAWVPPEYLGLAFGGAVVTAEFVSNTLAVFHFLALPAWVVADKDTFVNGDIVEFTIAANASLFEREIFLIAVSDLIDGLTAQLHLRQLYDTTVIEFLDATPLTIGLPSTAGANDIVSVNASSSYSSSNESGFAFGAVQESGGTIIRVNSATANTSGVDRVGVVRLYLDSNPAIFKDITITQYAQVGLLGVSTSSLTYPDNGGTQYISVNASPGTTWQAISNQSWCIVSGAIQIGSVASFSIFCNGRDLFVPAPRFATVTLVNTANPSNSILINVQQN